MASRGAALGDYDNDGDTDILIANCGDAASLLRNDGGNRSHWLQVTTRGTRSNRDGIGARIEVTAGDLVQIREVKSGSGLYSQNDLRVAFGLGELAVVDRMEVRWPSGTVDVLSNLHADACYVVEEGAGIVPVRAP